MIMNTHNSYEWAYQKLNRLTPLPLDCGSLCNQACCQGTEENGMWLFPGEDELFFDEPSFLIQPTGRFFSSGRSLNLLVCSGNCCRELRPLSCRIFPLVPYINSKELVMVDIDPRAKPICPITKEKGQLQPDFVRTVTKVCRELSKEPEVWEFLKMVTEEIEEYRKLGRLFGVERFC